MVDDAAMDELRTLCPGAQEKAEGGVAYIYLPHLKLACVPGGSAEALLCIQAHSGYATRLFFSQSAAPKGNNWTTHQILSRTWHTWSWRDVPATLRPAEILLAHLDALR